ncbi:MAG: RNA polymerase sigma factor RpoD/SigA [Candidatus Nomurabacteria bacterium]|nr:RNA polymerase sigma factor RpoD/SigA [Candidatus Nomurabacteria bacterium]
MRQLKILNQITHRDSLSLEKYLKDIAKTSLLNSDQEVELALKIRKGDLEALDNIVKANLRFVVSIAKQYQNQGLSLGDMINEGNIGLIKAAHKFDETKGFKFISYAVWWIRQSILQALVEQSRIVRLPLNKVGSYNKITKAMANFEQEFQREPTTDELEGILKIKKKEINLLIGSATIHSSIDSPINIHGASGTMYDILEEYDDPSTCQRKLLIESLKKEIVETLKILPDRDAKILKLYYGLTVDPAMTLQEIGDKIGLTRERVRQIKERSLSRLRNATGVEGLKYYLDM